MRATTTTLLAAVVLAAAAAVASGKVVVGVAKVDATLPVGVPLGGYSAKPRAWSGFPKAKSPPDEYTTFMTGSKGRRPNGDGTYVRCLILQTDSEELAIVTMDTIGSEDAVSALAYQKAKAEGFGLPYEKVQFSASHTHSGPAAITRHLLWQIAPALDVLSVKALGLFTDHIADAMVQAWNARQPGKIGVKTMETKEFTHNRRHNISPYVDDKTVDPHFTVMRVDDADGKVLATVWNLAIHGTCYEEENLLFSGDVQGHANLHVERAIGGAALFINGPAGDVSPGSGMCDGREKSDLAGGKRMSDFIVKHRAEITPTDAVELATHSHVHNMGAAQLNLTAVRVLGPCEQQKDIWMREACLLATGTHFRVNPHLGEAWLETKARFTGFRITLDGSQHVAVVSVPAEAITELGMQIRADVKALGFTDHIFAGYSNAHLGYCTTPREYDVGGYESLLTFFGSGEAAVLRANALQSAKAVAPH